MSRKRPWLRLKKRRLETNQFYFTLLGELDKNIDSQKAKLNSQKAYSFAKTLTEKQGIREKIDSL